MYFGGKSPPRVIDGKRASVSLVMQDRNFAITNMNVKDKTREMNSKETKIYYNNYLKRQ
jgi:hypothetical protein